MTYENKTMLQRLHSMLTGQFSFTNFVFGTLVSRDPLDSHKDKYSGSLLQPKCHHLESQVTKTVEDYFIENWPFSDEKAVRKFRDAGFSRVTCYYFPGALDERIEFACRLLTLLFLIDGMSLPNDVKLTILTDFYRCFRGYVI